MQQVRRVLRGLSRGERAYAVLAMALSLAMLLGRAVGESVQRSQLSFPRAAFAADASASSLRLDVVWQAAGDPGALAQLSPLTVDGSSAALALLDASAAEVRAGPTKVRDISPGWVSAEFAVVVDEASGQVLWEREANQLIAPASLTKIVTALVVLDRARLTDSVTIRVDSREMPEDSVMGVYPDEQLTVEDLLYGLMLPSGNDAALALAEHVSGTREAFVRLMNEKVRALGLTGSTFMNPHGRDAPGHLSTPYEMAMLAREGMRNPVFQRLASARSYETSRGRGYEMSNLNQLLWRYPGADGVKIGYEVAAGRTIVGSVVQNGHRVYVAMMRSADLWADSRALLDWTFASYEWP